MEIEIDDDPNDDRRYPVRCHGRWWSDDTKTIHVCRDFALPKKRRCGKHGPDGCRLDDQGTPVTAETKVERMTRGLRRDGKLH